MSRPTIAEVNLSALNKNVRKLKKLTNSKIYPVVKADAYGHGLKMVVESIDPLISGYCVARFEESLELRKITKKNIVCMEGPYDYSELKIFENLNIDYVIHSFRQISFLENLGNLKVVGKNKIWLKIDTGMNRLGFKENEILKAFSKINSTKKSLVLMSHLSSSLSNKNSRLITNSQIKMFKKFELKLKKKKAKFDFKPL